MDEINIEYISRFSAGNSEDYTRYGKAIRSNTRCKDVYPHVNMDVKAYVGSKEASLNLNVGTGNFMQDT